MLNLLFISLRLKPRLREKFEALFRIPGNFRILNARNLVFAEELRKGQLPL